MKFTKKKKRMYPNAIRNKIRRDYPKWILILGLIIALIPMGKIVAEETELSSLFIYDKMNLLEISIEDVGKYHGDICFGSVIGFRATQFAISQLWGNEIPQRKDFKIISASPDKGSQDAFEFITRAKTMKDFNLELPEGTSLSNISIDNMAFTFIQKSTGRKIKIWVKEKIFPEGTEEFFKLRNKIKYDETATTEEKEAFKSGKQRLKKIAISFPIEKLFEFKKDEL